MQPRRRESGCASEAALLLAAAPAAAQQPTQPRPDTAARDTSTRSVVARDTTLPRLRVAPGKAFYRSLILPGWGEASAGNYVRGAVFFALAATSDYMLVHTIQRIRSAEAAWQRSIPDTVARILADTTHPPMADTLRNDPATWHARHDTLLATYSLIRSRRRQREDRIFQSLFVTLIGGVDAYINAQLSDFPAGVGVEPKGEGRYEFRVDLALPRRRPPR